MSASKPLRRAVLQLAAVHADDRRWILAQLPAASRAAIEQLLTEIRALGIDDFQPWLQALDARANPPATHGANTAATNAGQWARWLLSQPESSALSFEERFTLESVSTRDANTTATAASSNVRLPPAWRGLLINALKDTPP